MSKFNIGDKVKIAVPVSAYYKEVGEVTKIFPAQPFPYIIDFSEHGVSVPFAADELELI